MIDDIRNWSDYC